MSQEKFRVLHPHSATALGRLGVGAGGAVHAGRGGRAGPGGGALLLLLLLLLLLEVEVADPLRGLPDLHPQAVRGAELLWLEPGYPGIHQTGTHPGCLCSPRRAGRRRRDPVTGSQR